MSQSNCVRSRNSGLVACHASMPQRKPKLSKGNQGHRPSLPMRTAQVQNFVVDPLDFPSYPEVDRRGTASAVTRDGTLKLSWAGAGIFFFWQLGAVKWFTERYDLTRVPMVGASGGALAAVLGGCGVDPDRVLEHAVELSVKHAIYERPLGLMGVWGKLIEQWLDDLLPDNAADMCRNRVEIIVTEVPSMRQLAITDFKDKADLINVAMTSSHVPYFLDLKLTRSCRGLNCFDGSVPDFITNDNSELLKCGGRAVIFDYFNDPFLIRKGRMDMLEVKRYEEIQRLMQLGYEYANRLHEGGAYASFDLSSVRLALPRTSMFKQNYMGTSSISSGDSLDE